MNYQSSLDSKPSVKFRLLQTLFFFAYGASVVGGAMGLATTLSEAQSPPRLQSPEDNGAGGVCPVCTQCPGASECPPTIPGDFTCTNPTVKSNVRSDISGCLGCSNELRNQAKACWGDCPNPPVGCCKITSCPQGQNVMNPNSSKCYCAPNAVICEAIGASNVWVTRQHNNIANTHSAAAFESWNKATWRNGAMTRPGYWSDMPTNGVLLLQKSPCLYKAWYSCYDAFATQGKRAPDYWGFTSYADTNVEGWYLDTCIMATVTRSAQMTLAYKGKSGASNEWDSWQGHKTLDANCNPIEEWQEDLLEKANCPVHTVNFNEFTSPVSLLWSPTIKIRDVESRSLFPLNPEQAGKWFIWKGSGLTPLVVWDPKKTGIIKAANQLFGNHTWDKRWKNGYEPLATLDKDNNGWLEGPELENISLWFDFNQDGVSDPGEVKELAAVKVEAIGTRPSDHDNKNGNIFADKGFRRKLSDKVIEGRSVDWFSNSIEGRFGQEVLFPALPEKGSEDFRRLVTEPAPPNESIGGLWIWRAIDPSGDELEENLPSGTLSLYNVKDRLAGHTIINAQLPANSRGLREQVSVGSIKGTMKRSQEGMLTLTFTSETMHGGTVETQAKLSPDGKSLLGFTKEETGPGKDPTSFTWIAQRVQRSEKPLER